MHSSRFASVGIHLPETRRTTTATEERLARENPHLRLPTGLIDRLTGIRSVHVRADGWQTSDSAAAASRVALERSPGPVDLLIFASASQDLVEPATAHIVSAKLGLDCPVFDVKNACNSMLNGIQVADALIRTGQHRRVLVCSGEQPSHAVRWRLDDMHQLMRSFAGYTMSDAGAAVLLEATEEGRGILAQGFAADSRHWNVGTLPTGGSINPHAIGGSYFDMDGAGLQMAFSELGLGIVRDAVEAAGFAMDELDAVAVHQVAVPHVSLVLEQLGVDAARIVPTVADHGNVASASLPLQLERAIERGSIAPGSHVLLVGLAGGISLGWMLVRW